MTFGVLTLADADANVMSTRLAACLVFQHACLGHIRAVRTQLYRMKPYVSNSLSRGALMNLLESRRYYIDSSEMWALADFPRVRI